MKKLLIICFLIGGLNQSFAQSKITNPSLDSLVSSKNFAVIITKISSKHVYSDSYESFTLPSVDKNLMNLSFLAQTNIDAGRADNYTQTQFFKQALVEPSYYNAYGISKYPQDNDPYHTKKGAGVYMVQYPEGVLVNDEENPTDIFDIVSNDFYAYQKEDYKVNVVKDGEKWKLTYTLGKGKEKRNINAEILEDGRIILKNPPVGNSRKYLYGYIADPASLTFNK
jgi:hypothetical protein